MSRRIRASYLLQRGRLIPRPIIEVDPSGLITSVEFIEEGEIDGAEHFEGVLFAGMVNAHTHLELSHFRGLIEQGGGFTHFASQMAHLREEFAQREDAEELRQRAIAQADLEMQREGVVAVGDIANGTSATDVKRTSPIYYHAFVEQFGLGKRGEDANLPPLDGFGECASYTPHSTYSLQSDFFERVVGASGSAPLSIHFMESPDETLLYEGRGEMHKRFCQELAHAIDFAHFGSPTQRVLEQIPSSRRVVLVHNVEVAEHEVEMILSHFDTPPVWVVCPCSNRYISRSQPPVEMLHRMGAVVAIGTDSLASNGSLSMLAEMQQLEQIPLSTRLDWATRGGARALGIEDRFGEIKVGARPGINLLQGADLEGQRLTQSSKIVKII